MPDTLEEYLDEEGRIDVYSSVVIENVGDTDFVGDYASRRYVIKPGQSRGVPYHGMVYWCGDPRAFDVPNDPKRRFRTDEFKRLRILYGVYDDMAQWYLRTPKLKVMSLGGKEITSVLEDPDGIKNGPPDINSEKDRIDFLTKELAETKARFESIMALMAGEADNPSVPLANLPTNLPQPASPDSSTEANQIPVDDGAKEVPQKMKVSP